MPERFLIQGGRPLRGDVTVSGSKNAALYAVAAVLLTADPITLRNVPRIADIHEMAEILRAVGTHVEVEADGETIHFHTPEITSVVPPAELVTKLRASFLVMGALLGRAREAECPPPGGDVIGSRPLDVHFVGFRALGATVQRRGSSFHVQAARLRGGRVFFDYPSVLGTVNVMFAAVLAEGVTTIVNAAPEPEVEMAADMLVAMGARIRGQGTPTIEIEGVPTLHGADFSIIPDRLEAGTYLLAGCATHGDVRVTNAIPHHLDSLTAKMREMGVTVTEDASGGIRAVADRVLQATQVQAVPYPGFATDLHPPMAAALTQAAGVSLVHERVYDNRTLYVNELRKLGARIIIGGDSVIIEGPSALSGSTVRALDIRAGAAVVVAALAAEGETVIQDIGHLDRGYADLQARLTALGAEIRRV
ncbi:MAG: UDP-N-acetylglucosamine 1-carboxyvinyltransferase [Chloroflexi bacterium]|nr:UDP-N-acetylglucosamine 1-carboxyvinyltransferase [Chloroflexota bacterium]MDA1239668.1 UDP-N-acetylglucosamine 1-carboxyvinyltransferase [Chloroflexota bacterium]MQC25530.1 UDP-N-acetylglucosamine 1-carboxyvinyltransferase [Chloroflexota bacterium]MQC47749.1 UDP-N-acetylglucosamine 1-carboxyvinyltransferase [Chloroflexota bacterium]